MESVAQQPKRPTAARSFIGTLNNPTQEPKAYLEDLYKTGKFDYIGG